MKLITVTITGADDSTNPRDLCRLSDEYRFVEWGILCSQSREGKEPRYPSQAWIGRLFDCVDACAATVRMSGHLCGSYSREAVSGPFYWAIQHSRQLNKFWRLQLNGADVKPSVLDVVDRMSTVLRKAIILQIKDFDCLTSGYVMPPKGGVQFLVDGSGGRGTPLECFKRPPDNVFAGYSGGIGPDNIRSVLEKLTAIKHSSAGHDSNDFFWIDMESNVRTDDKLDLDKVEACLKIASEFVHLPQRKPS